MTILLFANNAKTTLASPLGSGATSASLVPGTGSLFPNPTLGQGFVMSFVDAATKSITEIVMVTARSGDTVTIVRAQEGTTALNWSAGDAASNFLTMGTANYFIQQDQYQNGKYYAAIAGGTANAIVATLVSNLTSVTAGSSCLIQSAAANTGATTLNLTLGITATGAISLVKGNNVALITGDIPAAGYPMLIAYSSTFNAWVLLNPATVSLTYAQVITALGFTPYNATNPAGYISGITGSQVISALGYTPYNVSNPAGYIAGVATLGNSGQNYSNPSRAFATSYTNNTGAPILILVGVNCPITSNASLFIGGIQVGAFGASNSQTQGVMSGIVKNGQSYYATASGSTFITFWTELS